MDLFGSGLIYVIMLLAALLIAFLLVMAIMKMTSPKKSRIIHKNKVYTKGKVKKLKGKEPVKALKAKVEAAPNLLKETDNNSKQLTAQVAEKQPGGMPVTPEPVASPPASAAAYVSVPLDNDENQDSDSQKDSEEDGAPDLLQDIQSIDGLEENAEENPDDELAKLFSISDDEAGDMAEIASSLFDIEVESLISLSEEVHEKLFGGKQ